MKKNTDGSEILVAISVDYSEDEFTLLFPQHIALYNESNCVNNVGPYFVIIKSAIIKMNIIILLNTIS